jgi:hypothetical protein
MHVTAVVQTPTASRGMAIAGRILLWKRRSMDRRSMVVNGVLNEAGVI